MQSSLKQTVCTELWYQKRFISSQTHFVTSSQTLGTVFRANGLLEEEEEEEAGLSEDHLQSDIAFV